MARIFTILMIVTVLPGCAVIAVADAGVTVAATAVSVTATTVKVAAKTTGAVWDFVMPDAEDK